jgi:hypothetical protein
MGIVRNSVLKTDLSRLNGINMMHASMLKPQVVSIIMKDLQALVEKIENAQVSFPVAYKIANHVIEIQPQDFDYLKYLIRFDKNIQCLHVRLENDSSIVEDLIRYAYHVTSVKQRPGNFS